MSAAQSQRVNMDEAEVNARVSMERKTDGKNLPQASIGANKKIRGGLKGGKIWQNQLSQLLVGRDVAQNEGE
jgi:hypothetical protein